jgi:type I restriction enzyme, S subunit
VSDLLERHFDTAFAAPDGIKKLRELILTLALQGRLVPQDPKDQPASELLKEIETEKRRLAKSGKIKESKPLPEIKPEEVPYELPTSWEWVRLGRLIELISGQHLIPNEYNAEKVGFSYYTGPADFGAKSPIATRWTTIDRALAIQGDILLTVKGAGVGKTNILDEEKAAISRQLMALRVVGMNRDLVLLFLGAIFFELQSLAVGIAIPGIGRDDVLLRKFPLPPLPEQHRIVAKIDQLMARCDELEKLRAEQEQKRLAVHTAVIKQLLDAQEPGSFTNAWQFTIRNFGELYSVKENVAELRKAILQLSVMGKLAPQDPNDPPARELLEEIEAEKRQLVKEGKIKKPKPLPEIRIEDIPFKLPEKWQWVRLSSLAESIDYGTSQKTNDDSSLIPVYRMGNIVDGKLVDDGFKYIASTIDDLPRLYLKENDILFNRTNSFELVGKSAIYNGGIKCATFASYLIRVRLFKERLLPGFFSLAMNASYFRSTQIEPQIVQQCGQANFNGTKLSLCLVPLPPFPEQYRIVAKIDQLMALCNALEYQIDSATDKQIELLDVIMAQI